MIIKKGNKKNKKAKNDYNNGKKCKMKTWFT